MADVTCTVAQNTVTCTIAAVIINQYMLIPFTGVSQTLVSSYFAGKTLDQLIVQGNGGEWTTLNTGTEVTKASTASDTLTLSQDFGGVGVFKVLVT